ncbi:substrate-binding domain-containing protein [Mycobacterium sp. 663a-19]|uniref:substrate-binding domain-containing protein n=1 Tax=Mycobacterium sp. 663a-19 TaxID=2986148 RepID=UPI002D1F366F|nr:substrate-binding domain-containing protein [Mycobacterium sp. 663a-19]MEB3981346.1 substrate-binding domain-containing protein [Mycobacterium sp. 663a-19]
MGRHSRPDPEDEDTVDEPADESPADVPHSDYRRYADAGHYADEGYADEDYDDADYDDAGADEDYAGEAGDEYPEFPSRPAAAAGSGPPTPPGGHRGLGDWRGGHRSDGGRRGVSIGVIVALVAVVVVVGTVILWSFFGDVLSNRSHTAAARCVGGKEAVAVVVDPSLADQVQQFAESFNASAGPVGDHCMQVNVKPAGSDAVVAGFIGKWPAELGDRPALWIPASSVSAARLSAAAGQKTISDSRPLVTSPVVLAVRPELQQALANQSWATLPGLQTNPNALAGLNLPAWGSLRLALPTNGNGDAAYLAGEAVAAATAPVGAPPTQGVAAVRTLTGAQPKLADNSLTEAMNTLLKPGDAATAPVHAVVTTEQQLFARGQSLPDAKSMLASWLPPGPAAVADYPTVLLNGSWLSREQTSAASGFAHFMRRPEQLAKLAKAGFRAEGVKPPSSAVTSFPALPSTLSVGDDGMRATLADAMAAPSGGGAATIMLDQSMPGDEGGKSRLANVVAALGDRIKALPPTSVVGLWTFDGHEGRSEVTAGPLSDPVNGKPRSEALTAALDKQYSSAGGAVSFTTLRMLYQEMQAKYAAGQPNSILVITAGPHTDQTLDGPGLQNFIRTGADPAKPIAVNVIDFGADPDRPTWEAVAQLSGGSYQNLPTSASPALATAIGQYLG